MTAEQLQARRMGAAVAIVTLVRNGEDRAAEISGHRGGKGGARMTHCYRIDPATGQRVGIVEPPAEGPLCTRCGGAISAEYVRQCLNFGVRLSLICGRCRSPYGRGGK